MAFELMPLKPDSVTYEPGKVVFKDYAEIKASAERLAAGVKTVEVTPETVKTNRKLRAQINKQVKALNDYRIGIKKSIMGNYGEFEDEVKLITKIAKDANDSMDAQIKTLEEQERKEREGNIKQLFDLHVAAYDNFPMSVEDFLVDNPQALNKSTSESKAEALIATWIDGTSKDIAAINLMGDSTTIMSYYLSTHNLSDAINLAHQDTIRRENAKEALKEHVNNEPAPQQAPDTKQYTFTVAADSAPAVKKFMTDNNIPFTEKENY